MLRSGEIIWAEVPSQVVPALVIFGGLIDPEYPFLELVLEPGAIVIDVGAAIGQFTVFAARRGAIVHACEPSDLNLATLRRNVAANDVDHRVTEHRLALGASAGAVRFPTASTTYLSRIDFEGDSSPSDELVQVRRLDDIARAWGLSMIDVLKVNVAGYEPTVLDGAVDLLESGRVGIVIVLISREAVPWFEHLTRAGYGLFFYEPAAGILHRLRTIEDVLTWRLSPTRHVIAVHWSAEPAVANKVRILNPEPPRTKLDGN